MRAAGALGGTAVAVLVAGAGLGYGLGGPAAAGAAGAGAVGAAAIQWVAGAILLRGHGAREDVFLHGFGRASMLRVLGGTAYVIAALASGWFGPPLAFLAGFGAAYLAMEVVADVLIIRNEKKLDRVG